MHRVFHQFCCAMTTVAWVIGGAFMPSSMVLAQSPFPTVEFERTTARRLLIFRSDHFELITDLQPKQMVGMLDQFEAEVTNLGTYWGRPLSGKIKCFVVSELAIWPVDVLPDPNGRAKIAEHSGLTLMTRAVSATGKPVNRATVYSCADATISRREIAHAFCLQTFGRTGPEWFAEGLAEVASHWRMQSGALCPAPMAEYLRVDTGTSSAHIMSDGLWGRDAGQINSHRWGMFYLLSTHPRYSARFRQFGYDLLTGRSPDFARQFPEVGPQLDADYRAFCQQLPRETTTIVSAK